MAPGTEPSYENGTFDIFRGRSREDGLWVEAVVGFASARRRMEELAAKQPGDYFIFCAGEILAQISSGPMRLRGKAKRGVA